MIRGGAVILAQLRRYYLDRDISPAFQSVILAGGNYDKDNPDKPHSCIMEKAEL